MFNKKKKIETHNVDDVRVQTLLLGDQMNEAFQQTKDFKAAELALKFYNSAIGASKQQLIYKKLTGTPGEIPFFQDDSSCCK